MLKGRWRWLRCLSRRLQIAFELLVSQFLEGLFAKKNCVGDALNTLIPSTETVHEAKDTDSTKHQDEDYAVRSVQYLPKRPSIVAFGIALMASEVLFIVLKSLSKERFFGV